MMTTTQHWADLSDALVFLGNSLLAPINRDEPIGIEPTFWTLFPTFDDEAIAHAVEACSAYAASAQPEDENATQHIGVEFAKLFVGPPKPAAAPWETTWRGNGSVGFGESAVRMRNLLASVHLGVFNENNQYPDHMGIELLYASVLCARIDEGASEASELRDFLQEHPLTWITPFREAVSQAAPSGYYDCLLGLAESIIRYLAN